MPNLGTIAVIVPVYNCKTELSRCVESVLAQTYKDIRLYLVDDGSTDGSAELCREYEAQDSRIKAIVKSNEGPMMTALRGAFESTEEFLMFLDSDDWIEPQMIERYARAVDDSGRPQVVIGGFVIDREWNGTAEKKSSAAQPGVYEGERLKREIIDRILGNADRTVIMSRCMKLINRKLVLDNAHYCDPKIRMGDDLNVMLACVLDAQRLVLLEDSHEYHYVYRSSSLVHHYDARMYDNLRRLMPIVRQILKDKGVSGAEEMVAGEYMVFFLLLMRNELRNPAKNAGSRIMKICADEEGRIRGGSGFAAVSAADRMILWMLRKPDRVRIEAVRAVFRLRDSLAGRMN